MNLPISRIDASWTLFLDRDGVINRHIPDDYVKTVNEFEFLPGIPEAMGRLAQIFGLIFVATNQQGIGKGLYSEQDLAHIHAHMLAEISARGGRIDRIYCAPQLVSENSPMRKPAIGIALQAQKDYPRVDFAKSLMVGDTINDMRFGRNAGMRTVLIGSKGAEEGNPELIDAAFGSLAEFAGALEKARLG